MPRRNRNVFKGGNHHSRNTRGGRIRKDKRTGGDAAPLTPGSMHAARKLRQANG